jgi:hypothetical protein
VPQALAPLPMSPPGKCPPVRPAWRYLKATHDSINKLFDTFEVLEKAKLTTNSDARGRLGSDQVDLLRAAIAFASSGLDSCCHRLVADCAPHLIAKAGSTAEKHYQLHIQNEVSSPKPSATFIAAVTSANPRGELIAAYVAAKTASSFQGTGDLKDRVKAVLGLSNAAIPDERIAALDQFFVARNQIVHSLDYRALTGASVARNHRTPTIVKVQCDQVLRLVANLINATARLL